MAIKTQGTRLYLIDPADGSVLAAPKITDINGIDTTNEQLDITGLEDAAREYLSGLATPGQASFGLFFDTSTSTHVRMHQLKVSGDVLQWAVGFSDGTDVPTYATDTLTLPDTRSWISFRGYMANFPFSFAVNSTITTTVSIQISGEPEIFAKVPVNAA